jgi:4-amino-4-deoxy-L-arabinose transferase-like glycosyltransferase
MRLRGHVDRLWGQLANRHYGLQTFFTAMSAWGKRSTEKAVLVVILCVEAWMFSGAFGFFFNHDSLFYLIHSPRSMDELLQVVTRPDAARQYRPVTLVFAAAFVPLFGTDPWPYHFIPVVFHLANTVLFYLLTRRLLTDSAGTLAATGFWALHSVAGWVTYGITYISDFMMVFFALCCLILSVDARREDSRIKRILAVGMFSLALLSKEAAVALPPALLLCLVLAEISPLRRRVTVRDVVQIALRSLPLPLLCLFLVAVYAAPMVWWMQSGALYTQGEAAAYDIDPFASLLSKAKYLYWAFNLADPLSIPHPNRNRALALVLMGSLWAAWTVDLSRRKFKPAPLEWGGLLILLCLSLPAAMLSQRIAKWYLYLPLIGIALAFGHFGTRIAGPIPERRRRAAAAVVPALLLAPVVFSSAVQTRSFLNSSDSAYASRVVASCVADFRAQHPVLPPETTIYVLRTFEKNVSEFFGNGKLYELFYPGRRIRMLFADRGDRLPDDYATRGDVLILQYMYGHVYDVSRYYRERRLDTCGLRLVQDLRRLDVSVRRSEYYPSYDAFGTPGGTAAFFPTPEKDILTQIGGSTAVVRVGVILPDAVLRFDRSWMHDDGDGAWAEVKIRFEGREHSLYRSYCRPNPRGKGLTWEEVRLDLSPFAGRDVDLVLSCLNNEGGNTVADWVNWRDIAIESPHLKHPGCSRP